VLCADALSWLAWTCPWLQEQDMPRRQRLREGVAAFIAAAVAVIFAVSLAALGAFMRQVAAAPDAGPMRD